MRNKAQKIAKQSSTKRMYFCSDEILNLMKIDALNKTCNGC